MLLPPRVTYGKNPEATYRYENIEQSAEGINFDIDYHGKKYQIKSPLLGTYNAENITGCFAMAKEIGIAPGDITDAVKNFHGNETQTRETLRKQSDGHRRHRSFAGKSKICLEKFPRNI